MEFLHLPALRIPLLAVSNAAQLYVFLVGIFYFVLSFWGLGKKTHRPAEAGRLRRFAVVVAAHNEEAVLGCALESLKNLDYPKGLCDVCVVLDHCTDKSAEIAAKSGVRVFAYDGGAPRGKGHALAWLDEQLLAEEKYEGFCYFDADSLARPDFLKAMNSRLNAGQEAVQGFVRAKNPDENWLSRICHVSQLEQNYFSQLPKHRLGFSATLHGKGMCFSPEIIRRYPWDGKALTEDIELQARLSRNGVRIYFAPEAVVYDEVPVNLRQMVFRSIRWTKGALHAANQHLWGIAKRAVLGADKRAFENALRFSMCYKFALMTTIAALLYVYPYYDHYSFLFWIFDHPEGARFSVKLINWVPLFFWPAFALFMERAEWRYFAAYVISPAFYFFLGVPIFAVSVWSYRRTKEWFRTEHSCPVEIAELIEAASAETPRR